MSRFESKKYDVSKETIRALNILRDHPGINAWEFTKYWSDKRQVRNMHPAMLVARHLRLLKNKGLVRIRYSGDPFKEPTHTIYYLTDYGFEVCEYYRRLNRRYPT